MIEMTFLKKLMLIKISELKGCDVCHYMYFLEKGFNFQMYIYSGCHDLLLMSKNANCIVILSISG